MRQYIKPTRTLKSLQGLNAKQNGADAETLVLQMGEIYAREYRAEIQKRYEPYKRLGGGATGGTFRAAYLGKSGCDFELWLADGRAGHLEMKSRDADRISKDCIDEAQRAQLSRRLAWGQLALILVRLRDMWFLCSYSRWNDSARKSHNALQLREIGVQVPLRDGLPDFLEVLPAAIAPYILLPE